MLCLRLGAAGLREPEQKSGGAFDAPEAFGAAGCGKFIFFE